jgi:CopG antitoxin of type II toxin-antitoxin system
MSIQLKPVPKFANEAEERAFCESHDSTEYLDWTKAQRAVLLNFKPNPLAI